MEQLNSEVRKDEQGDTIYHLKIPSETHKKFKSFTKGLRETNSMNFLLNTIIKIVLGFPLNNKEKELKNKIKEKFN